MPDANSVLFGNTRCGVFYGPSLVVGQWIVLDCGYKHGITGRYLTLQLLERFSMPSKMEIREIEIEGWTRQCGNSCIQQPTDSYGTLYSNNDHSSIYDWRLVRYAPQRSAWHDATDKLR